MKKYSTKSSEWNPETYKNDFISWPNGIYPITVSLTLKSQPNSTLKTLEMLYMILILSNKI